MSAVVCTWKWVSEEQVICRSGYMISCKACIFFSFCLGYELSVQNRQKYPPAYPHLKRMGAFLFFILTKNGCFPVGVSVWVSQQDTNACSCEVSGKSLTNCDFVPGSWQTVLNVQIYPGGETAGVPFITPCLCSQTSQLAADRTACDADPSLLAHIWIKAAFSPVLKAGIQKKYQCSHQSKLVMTIIC